jgi:hypothetical protein
VLSDENSPDWVGARGRVSRDLLADHVTVEVGQPHSTLFSVIHAF